MATTKTRPAGKTVEEKKAQAAALHESIAVQVEQLAETDRWRTFLGFVAAFHTYSLSNVLLILAQYPEASQVAGFRTWFELGRVVRKGEHGIRIFGDSPRRITEEDEHGDEVERVIARYPMLTVFDISQTDILDGDTDRGSLVTALTGADDHGIIAILTGRLHAAGWTVAREPVTGSRNGYTTPDTRRVVIGSNLALEQGAKTMIHETAHVLMGHTDDIAGYAGTSHPLIRTVERHTR